MNLQTTLEVYEVHAYGTPEGAKKGCETKLSQGQVKQCGEAQQKDGREKRKELRSPEAGSRKSPIDVGANIERAAELIAQGKHVRLNQPNQVSTLVDKIKKDAEAMREKGIKPPDWNIAQISVPGTNLFAQEHLGIPRVEMPQLAGLVLPDSKAAQKLPKDADLSRDEVDLAPQFIDELRKSGIRVKDVTVQASYIRASQAELDGAKVGSIADRMSSGKMKFGQIFITKDNYILDGHHRWAATIVNDARDGRMGDLHMSAHKLDIDIGTALTRARDFQKAWGLAPAGMGYYVPPKKKKVAASKARPRRRWVIGRSRG